MRVRYGQLQTAMIRKGYRFFDEGDFNLNLIGIRSSDRDANSFNDRFAVAWRFQGMPHCLSFSATTDPGNFWRENPLNVNGTAILVPGQYPGLWQLGLHQGKYRALVQRKSARVYRDNNQDSIINIDSPIDDGLFGINCHRANATQKSRRVDRWSAGCQVLADPFDFALLISLCDVAAEKWGTSFTYTLLEEKDL
ncbi:hypothetical protein [Microbulbifer sp. VAAF005]|uniref:hypothetical protein n=1 Tax=Microbulbifer sp. VAAF005 TaxID=3034230 RepID=UPI0024ACE9F6|nr:hypothetical protein [Microbulbifer sp. VAAF005]WHI45036.1 hypothetical protein P0078_14985 [Microbulbifer sp. VAAF005]